MHPPTLPICRHAGRSALVDPEMTMLWHYGAETVLCVTYMDLAVKRPPML